MRDVGLRAAELVLGFFRIERHRGRKLVNIEHAKQNIVPFARLDDVQVVGAHGRSGLFDRVNAGRLSVALAEPGRNERQFAPVGSGHGREGLRLDIAGAITVAVVRDRQDQPEPGFRGGRWQRLQTAGYSW